jgi:hypothetical protein
MDVRCSAFIMAVRFSKRRVRAASREKIERCGVRGCFDHAGDGSVDHALYRRHFGSSQRSKHRFGSGQQGDGQPEGAGDHIGVCIVRCAIGNRATRMP